MGKYIIELKRGETAYKTTDSNGTPLIQLLALTPYTEPDLDAVKKEAYQQGYKDGYNKHDTEKIRKRGYDKGLDDIGNALRLLLFQYSNYTLQEIFGYDTARAVVEHFEGSEIVARIRCYEGGVKQDVETIRKEVCDKCMNETEDLAYQLYSPKVDEAYQRGLNDAWDVAKKISTMDSPTRDEIFGLVITSNIIDENSAPEAIEKIQKYEQEQDEIKVGNEVNGKGGRGIITKISDDGDHFNVMWENGSTGYYMIGDFKKTGRHFPEIAEVLRKMQEVRE